MKNNPYVTVLAIVFGLSLGIYFPKARIGLLLFHLFRQFKQNN